MDIKFIGSGASAKAILYYITNYITKSQLKTHVAYTTLELAVAKLGQYDPHDDDLKFQVKRLYRNVLTPFPSEWISKIILPATPSTNCTGQVLSPI
jgi:hypothetical protein